MNLRIKNFFSILRDHANPSLLGCHQCRTLVKDLKVRLKWVKNRGLDHVIDYQTDLKAASLLKDAIARSSTGFITSKSIADWKKLLGLTIPTLRFIRRYPTLFEEFPHPRYAALPCFRLTRIASTLHDLEKDLHKTHEIDSVQTLARLLMMTRNKMLSFHSIHSLKWDLGLPDDLDKTLIKNHPDYFRFVEGPNGDLCVKLQHWNEDFAISELHRSSENRGKEEEEEEMGGCVGSEYRQFKRRQTSLSFQMNFPRGYGAQKKVKAWMEEFQRLPYVSPYDDSSKLDPNSEIMEKRVVGVLHELLSLTMHKKTKRNYLRSLRQELNLPEKFTRIFTRYPGIFYLSLKCKTTTVALKEGYRRGRLVNPHPLVRLRDKFYYVMRTGLVYRHKGLDMIPELEKVVHDQIDEEANLDESEEEEEYEIVNGSCEEESSDSE